MSEREYHVDQFLDNTIKGGTFGILAETMHNLDVHMTTVVSQNLAPAYQAAAVLAFGVIAGVEGFIALKHGFQAIGA